jgi:hypothetical protein
MQLQRAHAVTELLRCLKEAVVKAKKKRMKQAAGLLWQSLPLFLLGSRAVSGACKCYMGLCNRIIHRG